MNDEPDVGLVYSHAEGVRGDDRANLLGHEGVLHLMARRVVEAGVITGGANLCALEDGDELIDGSTRGRIDDGESVPAAQYVYQVRFLLGVVPGRDDVVGEVGTVESGNDRLRVLERQLADYVAAYLRRSRSSERYRRRRAKSFVDLSYAKVARSKVMTPLADAMGFIDGEERHSCLSQPLRRAPGIESFRRDVEQLDLTTVDAGKSIGDLTRCESAIDEGRRQSLADERVDLI